MNVFTKREELLCISVYSVFTWKEKSQGISVDSTNDGNNCTTKKVNWKQTDRQTDLLCEFLQRNTDFNYPLLYFPIRCTAMTDFDKTNQPNK